MSLPEDLSILSIFLENISHILIYLCFFKKFSPKDFLIDFRERGRKEERRSKGEEHPLVVSPTHPDQDLIYNLGMCPDQELKLQPFSLQDDTPSGSHRPGQSFVHILLFFSHFFPPF